MGEANLSSFVDLSFGGNVDAVEFVGIGVAYEFAFNGSGK